MSMEIVLICGNICKMELDKQIRLGHLLFNDRKCRVCGETKNLVDSFYRTHKERGAVASSYSYECKECTIKRIVVGRKTANQHIYWEYPDW
jgi:hypothetical protein